VNEYLSSNQTAIYHFDFYRINSIDEAFDIGAEEYFYSGNLCLIEWADKVIELLPANYLKVSITYNNVARNYHLEMK
jgi:tRNA threonylcarbamoyladenosine biosynthesis protein TsaE